MRKGTKRYYNCVGATVQIQDRASGCWEKTGNVVSISKYSDYNIVSQWPDVLQDPSISYACSRNKRGSQRNTPHLSHHPPLHTHPYHPVFTSVLCGFPCWHPLSSYVAHISRDVQTNSVSNFNPLPLGGRSNITAFHMLAINKSYHTCQLCVSIYCTLYTATPVKFIPSLSLSNPYRVDGQRRSKIMD